MWLLIILLFIGLLFCWLLLSPIIVEIDTKIPKAEVHWRSIGKILLRYEGEWWLNFRILFFRKKIRLSSIMATQKKIEKETAKKKIKFSRMLKKIKRLMRTFRVEEWQLNIDTGDYVHNAWLYPLNFLPYSYDHMHINFRDENYLFIRIKNYPWKILYAYLR